MTRALLAVCPHWSVHGGSPSEHAARHLAVLGALEERLSDLGGELLATDGELVLAAVPSPEAALHAALDWVVGPVRGGSVGLGWGEVAIDAGTVHGADVARVRRIAWRAPPGVVLTTEAFRRALDPVPQGVGVYRAPQDDEHRIGFPVHAVADYRG